MCTILVAAAEAYVRLTAAVCSSLPRRNMLMCTRPACLTQLSHEAGAAAEENSVSESAQTFVLAVPFLITSLVAFPITCSVPSSFAGNDCFARNAKVDAPVCLKPQACSRLSAYTVTTYESAQKLLCRIRHKGDGRLPVRSTSQYWRLS